MAITLRVATEADIPGIVSVSTAAFDPATDAITRRLFPASAPTSSDHASSSTVADAKRSENAIREWSVVRKSARLNMERSVVMVAADTDSGAIVGYSMWFAPEEGGDGGEMSKPMPPKRNFEGFDREAATELRRIMEDDGREMFGEAGTDGVWNLDSLGVHPEQQKRGIGMKLLTWGIDKAKEQGRDCYLVATPAGVPLYRAAGFEEVRKLDVFGTLHVSMILRGGK